MSTMYYCWVCETQVSNDAMSDNHYENGRVIFFCSSWHWGEYQILRGL